jgi:alpha-beta hydrolase superfamily lysophospholipase
MLQPLVRTTLATLGTPLGAFADLVSRPFRVGTSEAERYEARTLDGWSLGLFRVRLGERPPFGPVLLQHGLAACHRTFLFPGRSLAHHLATRGFDVWVSDLRGTGASRRIEGPERWDWDLHDYLEYDVPAILGTIIEKCGVRRLQWVGHSMGGVLMYLYVIATGGDELAGGVSIASSLDYKVGTNGFQTLARYLPLARWMAPVPIGRFYRFLAPLAGLADTRFERFGYYPGNVERNMARAYYASVYHDVAPGVLLSLATTFHPDGFSDRRGVFRYVRHADRFQRPVLALAGTADRQCDPAAVEATVAMLGSTDKSFRTVGAGHGARTHYGHFDLVVGREAPADVWPILSDWLERHADGG